jgi:hypothetical protein
VQRSHYMLTGEYIDAVAAGVRAKLASLPVA